MLEATDFHPGRSGRNHLRTLSQAVGIPDSRVDEVLRTVELDGAARRRVKGYSLGMRQRLGLAAALLGDPELLVLDEPANGLDPEGVRWLRDFLRSFAQSGHTVLVSSHVLAEVAQTVDHVLIISHGKLVRESRLDELTATVGATVRVRSPQASELAEALAKDGITATASDHTLHVAGATTARVGEIAAAAGVVLHELVAEQSSLEEIFLELTADDPRVIRQARAELLKIRSTRTTVGLALGLVAIVLLFVLLTALLSSVDDLSQTDNQRSLFGIGSFAGVFAALAGIMLVTGEFRFGTIRPTFLFTPRRSVVLGREGGRELPRGPRLRGHRRGALGRDRRADPARARDLARPRAARLRADDARDDRRHRALGRDRRRCRDDRPKPGRRDHRPARLGVRRREPALRARARRGAADARPGPERVHGDDRRAPAQPRRRGRRPARLDGLPCASRARRLTARRDVS